MDQQLKELEIKPNKLAFQVALGFSLYTLFLMFLFKMLDIDVQSQNVSGATQFISGLLSYVPYILAIFYVQMTHRKQLGGYMSFGRGFSAGFRVGSGAGLFIGLLMILYYKVLDPEAMNHMMDIAIEKANDDENQIKGIEAMRPYMAIMTAFIIAITYTLIGLVISLIGAAIFKKEKPLHYEQ
jgi:flagellar biosynthesis protein FliQ